MYNLSILKRQHSEISVMLTELKKVIRGRNFEGNASAVAGQINILAGKLKVHLNTEDQYMYPQLLQSDNEKVRDTAQSYIDEMQAISRRFMEYKERFKTKTKIIDDLQSFFEESNKVFEMLETRIEKENTSLYAIL